jgi:hypothetical protein
MDRAPAERVATMTVRARGVSATATARAASSTIRMTKVEPPQPMEYATAPRVSVHRGVPPQEGPMIRTLVPMLLGMLVSGAAVAGPYDLPQQPHEDIVNPPANSADFAIIDTIQMLLKGDHDAWIEKWCDPERCHDKNAKDQWKAYQLKSATQYGKQCLHGDNKDTLWVTRRRGDLATDGTTTVYFQCEDTRLPVPITLRLDKANNKTYVVSLSI